MKPCINRSDCKFFKSTLFIYFLKIKPSLFPFFFLICKGETFPIYITKWKDITIFKLNKILQNGNIFWELKNIYSPRFKYATLNQMRFNFLWPLILNFILPFKCRCNYTSPIMQIWFNILILTGCTCSFWHIYAVCYRPTWT